jgi:hypothetical protein
MYRILFYHHMMYLFFHEGFELPKLSYCTSPTLIYVLLALIFMYFVDDFSLPLYMDFALPKTEPKLRPCNSYYHYVYLLYFLRMIRLFSLQFMLDSHFGNLTFILPGVNKCSSHSHTFVFPSR